MSALDRKFLAKLGNDWRAATPSLRVQAFSKGKKALDVAVGDSFDYYDFASVTKILATTTAFMIAHEQKRFKLSDPVSAWVPWFPEHSKWRLRDLLCHSAGLTWWYPFYKEVAKKTSARTSPEGAWDVFQKILRKRVLLDFKKRPRSEGPSNPPKSVYSDLDFFMLGIALEAITGKNLYSVWQDTRDRVGLRDTDYHRENKPIHKRSLYAPTENDRAWRGKTLQGEVHDQNTWALKGVAPHAGLFGPIDDLSRWGLSLRKSMLGHTTKNFPPIETVRLFTKRAIPRTRGDWALGFMLPSKVGSSTGSLFSPKSVGHTGFTGTSLWFDPERDLLVTILSNRIHPTVDNIEIRSLRPKIHTWIAEEF